MADDIKITILGESLPVGGHAVSEKGIALQRETIELDTIFKIGSTVGISSVFGMPTDWAVDRGRGEYSSAPIAVETSSKTAAGETVTRLGTFTFNADMDSQGNLAIHSLTVANEHGRPRTVRVENAASMQSQNRVIPLDAQNKSVLEQILKDAISNNKGLTLPTKPAIKTVGSSGYDHHIDAVYSTTEGAINNTLEGRLPTAAVMAVTAFTGENLYSSKDEVASFLDGIPYGHKATIRNMGRAIALNQPTTLYANLQFARAQLNETIKKDPGAATDERGRILLEDGPTRKLLGSEIDKKISELRETIRDNGSSWPDWLRWGKDRVQEHDSMQLLPKYIAAKTELADYSLQLARKAADDKGTTPLPMGMNETHGTLPSPVTPADANKTVHQRN